MSHIALNTPNNYPHHHFLNCGKLATFVQVNMLLLYQKAQSDTLSAQELASLESEAREHPYFSLPYIIAARHHYTQKTTVRDRALLISATYALNRPLLQTYVVDTQPHQPQAAAPKQEESTAEAPEITQEEVPAAETTTSEQAPEVEIFTATSETQTSPVETQTPAEAEEAQPITPYQYPQVALNWFIDTRLRLRIQKYHGPLKRRILAALAENAKQQPPASQEEAPTPTTIAEATPVQEPSPVLTPETAPVAAEEAARQESYAIGSFSSFTFLDEPDTAEVLEDDEEALIMERESVELQTPAQPDAPGEIIFEEGGKVIEIVVSQELLAKYFKGRLPVDLSLAASEEPLHPQALEFQPQQPSAQPQPEAKAEPKAKATKPTHRAADLIDRFIESEPSISRSKESEAPTGDLARDSSVDNDDWVTETLAKIYAKQGNKSKAIKIYQKLSLLFPDKRDYFALRISELK